MKKNKMMRIASILMVATLITTCAISGTFAKYVTTAEGEDTARVAKWGIVLGMQSEDLFADKYATDEKGEGAYTGEFSVVADPDNNVVKTEIKDLVAPGTKSVEAATATVFGTPEVATRYSLTIDGLDDVFLKAGTYTDFTKLVATTDNDGVVSYGYTEPFTLTEDYAPVKWDIKVENEAGTYYLLSELAATYGVDVAGFSITEAAAIFAEYKTQLASLLEGLVSGASNAKVDINDDGVITMSMDFDPNTEMDYTFTLTWSWAFEQKDENGEVIDLYDKADTLLGNLQDPDFVAAAKKEGWTIPAEGNYNLVVAAHFVAAATQID